MKLKRRFFFVVKGRGRYEGRGEGYILLANVASLAAVAAIEHAGG